MLPPHALELEQAVLGACLLERVGLVTTMAVIKHSSVFYIESHQLIFEAICNLFNGGGAVDILTITKELRRLGYYDRVGGSYAVTELTSKVNSSDNLESHIRLLQEFWIRRMLADVSYRNYFDSFDEQTDVFQLFEKVSRQVVKLQEQLTMKRGTGGEDIYDETIHEIEVAMENPGLSGVTSGIPEIDRMTGGWQKSDLIILAARPGMGKTAFAMSISKRPTLVENKTVMFFSLEMKKTQLMMRQIAAESGLSLSQIRKGHLTSEELLLIKETTRQLRNNNLVIDDSSGITVSELRAKVISQKIKNQNLGMVIVDYLQLMSGDGMNREQEISSISRGLKSLAKELDVPIIALSQLSRSVETRGGDKRPQLSDLRESGAIEQDADVVIFLYRPEYYKIDCYEDGTSTAGHGDVIFAKHRNGPIDTITIGADMKYLKYHSLETNQFKPSVSHPDKFTQSGSIDNFESNSSMVRDEYNKSPF